jgi:hypothetical protein
MTDQMQDRIYRNKRQPLQRLCPNRCRCAATALTVRLRCSSIIRINSPRRYRRIWPSQHRTDFDDRHHALGQRDETCEEAFRKLGQGRTAQADLSARSDRCQGRGDLSAKGRGGGDRAVEFPHWHGDGANGGHLSGGQPGDGQASEYTERVADLFAEAVPKYFAEEEMAVFTGGVEAARLSPNSPLTI